MSDDLTVEVIRLRVNANTLGWEAVAVRLGDDSAEPWHVFVSYAGSTRWLTPIESDSLPAEVVLDQDEERLAKLVELYGAPWEEITEDAIGTIGLQSRALDELDESTIRRLNNTPLDEMAQWRDQWSTVTEAELLYARLTGSDPLAVRN